MPATVKDFEVGVGETFSVDGTLRDSAGTPVPLEGSTLTLRLMKQGSGDEIDLLLATLGGPGEFQFKATDEVTATWPPGRHAYVVEREDAAGDSKWLLRGMFRVIAGWAP